MESDTRSKPVLIIPACGKSQRFKDVGIQTPKGLIKFVHDGVYRTMIEHVIPDLWMLKGTKAIVVANADDAKKFQEMLPHDVSVWALGGSRGQAHTIQQILQAACIGDDQKIIVVNCDDKFPQYVFDQLAQVELPAAAVVFKTEKNPRYGYVNDFPRFQYGAEKNPISEYALAGAFMFRNKKTFLDAYNKMPRMEGEPYISHVFAYIAGDKKAILCDRKEIGDFGTPESLSFAIGHDIVQLHKQGAIQ